MNKKLKKIIGFSLVLFPLLSMAGGLIYIAGWIGVSILVIGGLFAFSIIKGVDLLN